MLDLALMLAVLVLSAGLGYVVIRRIPSMLHTPLMSGMNALSGITVLGALVTEGETAQLSARYLTALTVAHAARTQELRSARGPGALAGARVTRVRATRLRLTLSPDEENLFALVLVTCNPCSVQY